MVLEKNQKIDSDPNSSSRHVRLSLLYAIFFVSGMSSLICEITWARMLVLVLGNTLSATGMILRRGENPESARIFRNALAIARSMKPNELIPYSDGMCAGRFIQILEQMS